MADFRLDQETRTAQMMRGLMRWMKNEHQVILRSKGQIRYISVSRFRQIGLTGLALAFLGWVGFASISYFELSDALIDRNLVIAQSEKAYSDLKQEVKQSRGQFFEIAGILENNHAHLADLLRKDRVLKSDLKSLRRSEERRVGKECRSRWSPDH